MLLPATFGVSVLFLGSVAARTCHNLKLEVEATARNGVFGNLDTPQTNLDATAFALSLTQQGVNLTENALTGYATVSGRYTISAQYCKPSHDNGNDSIPHSLQILTHGIGFDKTYWDLSYHNYNYSYVDYALSQGYHTFAYDRLGVGESSHGDPKNEIQIFLEIDALAALTRTLRGDTLRDLVGAKAPAKVIHVGHSFGSAQTYALTALHPNISDAIVLTGFSPDGAFLSSFVAGGGLQQAWSLPSTNPTPLSSYPPGYLADSSVAGVQYQFFHTPNFDPELLILSEQTQQPVAIGELLSQGGVPHVSTFAGPVFVITGSNDVPFCGGNCYIAGGGSIPAAASALFPSAHPFEATVEPNTGHGINMHYSASNVYSKIQKFLKAHGLETVSSGKE